MTDSLIEKLEKGSPKGKFTAPEHVGYAAGYKDAFDIVRQHEANHFRDVAKMASSEPSMDISRFSVLEQCYCMSDAPSDDYPEDKGVCQYCQIKALLRSCPSKRPDAAKPKSEHASGSYFHPNIKSFHLGTEVLSDEEMVKATTGRASPSDYGMVQVYPSKSVQPSLTKPSVCDGTIYENPIIANSGDIPIVDEAELKKRMLKADIHCPQCADIALDAVLPYLRTPQSDEMLKAIGRMEAGDISPVPDEEPEPMSNFVRSVGLTETKGECQEEAKELGVRVPGAAPPHRPDELDIKKLMDDAICDAMRKAIQDTVNYTKFECETNERRSDIYTNAAFADVLGHKIVDLAYDAVRTYLRPLERESGDDMDNSSSVVFESGRQDADKEWREKLYKNGGRELMDLLQGQYKKSHLLELIGFNVFEALKRAEAFISRYGNGGETEGFRRDTLYEIRNAITEIEGQKP
ncbi:hypothetical protein [Zavarzinella formosa]|uniref:hypothetical protein n=1 Tax=Zavarzinella formosa TaxID=360055 RepID=UPI0003097EA7|nr:hypothetical protein [Zavarzinella formosa]